MINDINDAVILAARLFLATLFLIFGWRKLRDYSGTVSQIVQLGGPMPVVAAAVAIFMELPVAFAVAVGAFARPSALLMVLYTLGTALIGHRYWTYQVQIESTAWMAFTKISASWEASCCCTLLVRENIRSMHCAVSPRHNLRDCSQDRAACRPQVVCLYRKLNSAILVVKAAVGCDVMAPRRSIARRNGASLVRDRWVLNLL